MKLYFHINNNGILQSNVNEQILCLCYQFYQLIVFDKLRLTDVVGPQNHGLRYILNRAQNNLYKIET